MKFDFDIGIRADWTLLITNGQITVEENQFVGVRDNTIACVRKFKNSDKKKSRKFLDRPNHVLLPGFVNAHCHLGMTLFKGLAEDLPLRQWLDQRILPLEAQFVNPEFVRIGTELAALECIQFGTTTVNDHYHFFGEALKVWEQVGLRGNFIQYFNGVKGPEDFYYSDISAIDRFVKNFEKYREHPRLNIGIGPHAPYSCDDEMLRSNVALAERFDTFLHIHLAETQLEIEESIKNHKCSSTERLHKLGVLGPRTIAAHCIYFNDYDVTLIKNSGASCVYNPDSNAKLASGVAQLPKLFSNKISVALGTDGSVSANDLSMFGVMDLGAKLQKLFHKDASVVKADEILFCATLGGARALGLGNSVGSIEEGKRADLIMVDFNYPHLQPINDIISSLVYSCQGLEVNFVMCDGKILRDQKKWMTLDPNKIYARVKKIHKKIFVN